MGNRTKIIASVFPKLVNKKKNTLKVQVFLTFRLPDTKDGRHDQKLKDYYHIYNWPKYEELFKDYVTFTFRNIADPRIKIIEQDVKGTLTSSIDGRATELWRKMFPDDTKVFGWVLDETPFHLADSATSPKITKRVVEAIDKCIINITDNPALVDPWDPDNLTNDYNESLGKSSNLASYLEKLKAKRTGQIIIDPILRDLGSRPGLKPLFDELVKINDEFSNELQQRSLDYSLREAETRNFEETSEFHKRYSAYSNHPELLKKTGCILEYEIQLNDDQVTALKINDFYLRMNEIEEGWNAQLIDPPTQQLKNTSDSYSEKYSFFQEVSFYYPYTCTKLTDTNFKCVPKNKSESAISLKDNNGVLLVKRDNVYEIKAEIVDKNQILQKIKDLLVHDDRMQDASQRRAGSDEDMQRLLTSENERKYLKEGLNQTGGIPEYISSGITVFIKNLKKIVEAGIKDDPEKNTRVLQDNQVTESAAFIYSENAFGGYRVDVISINKDQRNASSLCLVNELYDDLPDIVHCEGSVTETAQVSRSGKLFVDEELFRWNDWSLVAPQPGTFNDNPGTDKNKLKIEMWPLENSLIPLRFGNDYRFRFRLVDICGNSVGPIHTTADLVNLSDEEWTPAITYQRVEPINTPFIVPGTKLLSKQSKKDRMEWESEHWGEDAVTMVIRSRVDEHDLIFDGEKTIRYLGPPKANLNFVLQHGSLDNILSSSNPESERKHVLHLADAQLDDSPTRYFSHQRDIDYLYDPLAIGFSMVIDSDLSEFRFYNDGRTEDRYMKEKPYFKTVLRYGEIFKYDAEPGNDQSLVFSAPKGLEKTIEISCLYENKRNAEITRQLFYPGVPITKSTMIHLIHATQRPCLVQPGNLYPNIAFNPADPISTDLRYRLYVPVKDTKSKLFFKRTPGKTDCNVLLTFDLFPCLTSESYLLHIKYPEITCDRTSSTGMQVKLVDKVIKTGFLPEKNTERDVIFSDLQHFFDDTRHRPVYYQLEAVSKFKKYFDPRDFDGNADAFSIFSKLNCKLDKDKLSKINTHSSLKDIAEATTDWPAVPSSARPEMPVIDRIVPLIKWEINSKGRVAERRCEAIRIYFSGDWYSSGFGEKVAIMFMENDVFNSSNVLSLTKQCIGTSLDKVISQFGKDPAAGPQQLISPDQYVMHQKFFQTDSIVGATKEDKILLRKMEYDRTVIPETVTPAEQTVEYKAELLAAIYDIQFLCPDTEDDKKSTSAPVENMGQFFVDVIINADKIPIDDYMPFIRLAIARYQENSIETSDTTDYRFSKIVVTDFVQLLPHRKLEISSRNINYKCFNLRKNAEKKPTSELYVFATGNKNVPEHDLQSDINCEYLLYDTLTETSGFTKMAVDKGEFDIDIPRGAGSSIIINEYEVYDTPVDVENPVEIDPRNNYSRRLIFSYAYDSNTKDQEQEQDQQQQQQRKEPTKN